MKAKLMWVLAVLNVLLLVALAGRLGGESTAQAQVLRPGEFIMVPGEIVGQTSSVVYFLDTSNGILGAMAYEASRQELVTMAPIDLNAVFNPQ